MVNDLVIVKCPFSSVSRTTGLIYECPQVVVKVYPGSRGEGWCRRHKKAFEFEVDSQHKYKSIVRVQHEDSQQPG